MLLQQISTQNGQVGEEGNSLATLVLANMIASCPILQYAQFYSMTGDADNITAPANAAGGNVRTMDNDYTPVVTDVDDVDLVLKIMGDKVNTDISRSRRGYSIQDERVRQLESFAKGFGRFFMDKTVNGSGADGNIFGWASLVDAGQVFKFAGNNGGDVPLGNSDTAVQKQLAFLEAIDNLIGSIEGGAEFISMNYLWKSRLKAIALGKMSFATIQAFGVEIKMDMYNGVPIVDPGYAKNKTTLIIPNTQTLGTSTGVCSSIWAGRYGEKENLTFATNEGVQVKDMGIQGIHYQSLIDFDVEQALVNEKSLAQLAGLKLS